MDIRTSVSAAVLALALATPSLAQQTSPLSEFELPPDPDATPTPEVQGPVDPEAEVRTTPRVIPTETPTPQPSPTPTVSTPAPTLTLPPPRPTPPPPSQTQDAPEPEPQPEPTPTVTGSPEPAATEPSPLPTEFAPSVPPAVSTPDAAAAEAPESDGSLVPWLAALVAALALAGGAFWYFRRREELAPAPVIEPPLARRQDQPQPDAGEARPVAPPAPSAPPPKARSSSPVTVQAQPVRMSRSMMNATFAFRLVLENQSLQRWEDLSVEADLVTAHGAAPVAEQLADAAVPLAPLRTVEVLEAGDTAEIADEVRLPLGQVRAIPQGRAAVYVPLLRVRVAAKGKQPLARTFLIGQLPDRQGGRLRPFRLDEMPQSYQAIGLRPLD